MERLVLLLLALVASVFAGPMQRVSVDTCSKTCTESSKFRYTPGNSYEYGYRSNVRTLIQGASADEAGLILSATVNLDVLSKCELSMRLSDVKLEELDPNSTPAHDMSAGFAKPLEQNPVRVSFQDGEVEHLCPTGLEPTWVMNVKRGIISLIQNKMEDFEKNNTVTESDVSGECVTSYEVSGKGWYTTTITKTKDLLGCKGRQGYNSAVQGIPYTSDSNIQSLPIVKSQLTCTHDMDTQTGFLRKVTCEEQHVLRPFSNSEAGAVAKNSQELKFLKQTRGIRSPVGVYEQGVSLKFEHENQQSMEDDAAKNLKRKLLEVCQMTKYGVQAETPSLFTNLVYLVKSADAETLQVTYDLVDGKSFCADNQFRTRKFFLDALPMAGTSGALRLMTNLIVKKTVTGAEAESWITSLAFIKNPTQDMLKDIKPLINIVGYEEKTMLSVGTLIHNYCQTEGGCNKNYLVTALISAIENKMAKKCKVTPANKKVTLMALRGLGNAGYAMKSIPTLEACMDSPLIEIRLSAIDAFRRMPCDVDRSKLQKIFLDGDEDSETRIAAYRSLMQCPTPAVLAVVKNALEKEEVNQVGSYVWTHLTNLMETSDRHKQDIRAILEDATFKNVFDLDKRKYSRNYEGSFFLDAVNTGAKLEGDLIWSSKSFIPRSSMVNLTVDLFGHSVNLFELGGRIEGLEYLLESFFGPSGYFSQKSMPTFKDVVPQGVHADKMKRIDNRFGAKMEELRGSMFMRVFGNELKYCSFDSLQALLTASDVNILDMMVQLAKDNDYTYSHSSMFLDSSIIIPTGAGLPLNLTVNGTSTVDLRMKGKMDLRTPPHVTIDGLIQPSAAIDISTMMSVDAFVTRPGIKMVSTLHSSTAVEGKLTVQPDGSISAEYLMPQPKMEIIDVKTSFFTVHANIEKEQPMITDNRHTVSKCSAPELVTVTGLELCSEISYPNASQKANAPYFPFTGPVSAGLYLYKRDTHTKYQMNIKSIHDQKKNIVHFSLDTPGSRIDRHLLADVTLDKSKQTLDMTLTSPWTRANMQGTFVSTKGMTGLNGKMSVNGEGGYSLDAKLVKDRVGNAHRYTPSLEVTLPRHKPISLQGIFMYNGNRQFDIQFSTKGITESPMSSAVVINNRPNLIGLKASLELTKDKPYSIDVSVSNQETKKKIVFTPQMSVRSPAAEVMAFGGTVSLVNGKKLDINLVLDKVVKKKVSLKAMMSKLVKRRGRIIYRTITKFASEPADFQLDVKLDNRNFRVIATDIDMTYIIRRFARNNIKLVSKVQNLSTKTLTKGKAAVNMAVKRNPELNVKLIGNVNHNKKHSDMDLDVRYGANFKDEQKHLDMAFSLNRNIKGPMDASADIMSRFRFPGQGLNMMMKGNHKHTEQDLDTNLEVRLGKNEPVKSTLRMWERWESSRKLSGEFLLSYPGRQLAINHTVQEAKPDKFVSILNGQTQKGKKSSVTTVIDMTKADNLRVTSDWLLNGHTPTHLEGEVQVNPMDFITSFAVEKDSKRYASSLKSKTIDMKDSTLTLDFEHPARRVILGLEANKKGDVVFGEADLRWNAVKNDSDRVTIKGRLLKPTLENFNGSLSLSYPSRTLTMNLRHQLGNKYSCYADFQWDADKKVSAETIIGLTDDSLFGTGKLATPFTPIKKLDIEVELKDNSEEYTSDIKLTRNAGEYVSFSTVLKKPISLHTFVATFLAKNNIADIKNVRLDIDHKLSNSLASSGKFMWNRQQVQASVVLQNTSKPGKLGVTGTVDIKTTMKSMKKVVLTFSHGNDGRVFNTMAKFTRNRKVYSVSSKINHLKYAYKYENKGSVDVIIPTEKYLTSWSHSHALKAGTIATTYSTKWGKKQQTQIAMKFDATYKNDFSSNFKLETPFKAVHSVQLISIVASEDTFASAKLDLLKDEEVVAASEIGYRMDNNMAKAGATLAIPELDVDSNIQAIYDNSDMTASFTAVIMPEMTASLDFKSGLVLWKSTFPGIEQIRFSYEIEDGKQLIATETLEYGEGKVIRLQTRLQADLTEKRAFLELTTPYQMMTKFSTGINFLGDLESFDSDASIEIQPLFNKISAEATYDTKQAVSGKLRLDTPFESYQYFQTDFSGKITPAEQKIHLQIEYLPRQIVKFELDGQNDQSKTTMNAKLSIPDATASIEHKTTMYSVQSSAAVEIYNEKYALDLDHTFAQKLNTIVTVTVPSKRPVIFTVSHEGSILDFKTHAEIQRNRKNNFIADIGFKATDTLSVTAQSTLQTELISAEGYTVAVSYSGLPRQFNSHAEFSSTSLGKSTVDLTFGTDSELSGSFSLISPQVKNIKTSFRHFYSTGFIQTKATFIRGGKKLIKLDASLKSDQSIVAELYLKTPIVDDIQGLIRMDGESNNFVLHTEGSLGPKKVEVEYSSRFGTWSLQQTITVKAPVIEDITVDVSLTKSSEYKGYAEVQYGVDKHRVDVGLRNLREGSFSLESPLVAPVTASFNIQGSVENFMTQAEFSMGQKKSEVQVSFQKSPTLKGSLTATSPYMKKFAASFEHIGQLPEIISKAKMTLGDDDFDAKLTLSTDRKFASTFTLTTPFREWQLIQASASHEGALDNFRTQADYSIGQYKSNMELSFKIDTSYNGQLTVSSHLIPDLSASFGHSGPASNFETIAEITYDGEKHKSEVRFRNQEKLSAHIDIQSTLIQNVDANIEHSWIKPQEIKCHADIKVGTEKSNADISLTWSATNINSLFTLNNPFTEDIKASFNHNGRLTNFVTKAEISMGSEQNSGEISFNLGSNTLVSGITIKSAFVDLSANFKHGGELKKFATHGDMTVDGSRGEIDVNVNILDRIEMTATVTAPNTFVHAKLNHDGTLRNFVSSFDLTNDMDTYSAKASLKTVDDIMATVTMTSPIKGHESYKVEYTHTGKSVNNFRCHLEVETPSKSSTGDLTVDGKGAILDVSYPKMKVKLLYNMVRDEKLEAESELTMLDFSYAGTASLARESGRVKGSIEMKSADSSIAKLSGYWSKASQYSDKVFVEMTLNDEHSEIEATFTSLPNIDGDLSVRSAYFPHIDLSVDFSGNPQNFIASSEILVNGERKGKIEGQFDLEDKQSTSLSLETPFTNFTSMSVDTVFIVKDTSKIDTSIVFTVQGNKILESALKYTAGASKIDSSFVLTLQGDKIVDADLKTQYAADASKIDSSIVFTLQGDKIVDAGLKYTTDSAIQGDAHFDSVYLHVTKAMVRLDKEGNTYKASSGLAHDGESWLSAEGELTMPDNLLNSAGSIKIEPHFTDELASLEMKYNLANGPEIFRSYVETSINKETYIVDLSADNNNQVTEASFSVKVPSYDPVKGSFSYKNKFSKYIVQADFELDSDTKYELTTNIKTRNGLAGKVILTAPIEGMTKTTVTISHEGTVPNIKSTISVVCDDKTVSASADLTHGADKTSGTFKFASPIESLENIEATFSREGDFSDLKANSKITYARGQAIEATVQHMLKGTTLKSSLTFMSPYTNEIKLSASHTGAWNDFSSEHELTMGPDNRIKSDTTFKTGSQYMSLVSTLEVTMIGETTLNVVELKHDGSLEKFRTEAKLESNKRAITLDTSFQLNPVIEASVSLTTPFKPVKDCKVSISHRGGSKAFLTTAEVQYAPLKKLEGRLDVQVIDVTQMDITAELKTPFTDYESNKISYHHSGSISNLNCELSANVASKDFFTSLSGKLSPPNLSLNIRTPFEDYKNIEGKFSITKNDRLGRFSGHLEGSWSATKAIVMEVSLSSMHNKVEGNAVVSTPFAALQRGSVEFSHQVLQGSLMHMLKASLNGKSMVDIDTDFNLLTDHKHARITSRAPLPMKYEVEGDFTLECVDIDATANINTQETGNQYKLECGYDIRRDNKIHFKLNGQGQSIDYKGQFLSQHISSELDLKLIPVTGKYGFDMAKMRNGGTAKVMLPSRTLAVSGSIRSRVTEASFMWDADRDQNKKVEIRSVIIPSHDSVKMDVTLRMPSLGKQVQLGSEMIVNRGRVIFEGKTELSYSSDARQKILFSTKLEDVSSGQAKNYSFNFDISHPYSTVGIKLASHIGKSSYKYSAGMGLEYLTARRQTKTFQINGMVNKLRKTASFELQSPVKSISIASSATTGKEFQVTLTNTYDRRTPLITTFTISPAQKSIEFTTNYDLDTPSSTFHMQLHYPNSKRVEAEAWRMVNGVHVTDALAAANLNNSHLLHTRLHWRPSMLTDLQAYKDKKAEEYRTRGMALLGEIEVSVLEEVAEKSELIYDALERELGPQTMARLTRVLRPVILKIATGAQEIMTQSYSSYLMPMKDMTADAQLKYKSVKPSSVLSSVPSAIPSFNMDTMDFSAFTKLARIGRVIRPTPESYKYDTYTNIVKSVVLKEIDLALKDLSDVHINVNPTVWDPKNGEIQVEFDLPIALTSLDAMPVIDVLKYVRRIKNAIPSENPLDMGTLAGEWVPPFTGVASIKNGNRIETFDGYVYDLPTECTFVLARDYTNGNFSLLMSNKDDTTLTLLSDGPAVSITVTGEIIVAGEKPTLPYTNKDLKIYKIEENTVKIELADHVSIEYDLNLDHAIVRLNGWYHGKTGGLLGTYDNEPSNDLMTSFGKVNSNQARFAKTWDVGKTACA